MTGTASASEWATAVMREVATIIGPEQAAQAAAAWDSFAGYQQVVVTVYGPYNAGKSTLIKRLLADAGATEPDWLTISGRTETFQAREAACGALILVDTPGIAAGNPAHRQAAEAALARTDALLITWPAGLATSEQAHLAEVIAGGFYGPAAGGYFPVGALFVVIAKADTTVPDAASDPEGYAAMRAAKQDELRAMLSALAPGAVLPPVLAVSADPFEAVGPQRQPPARAYDESRGWDGVSELQALLALLSGRLAALRAAAQIRWWSRLAVQAMAEASAEETRLGNRGQDEAAAGNLRRNLTGDLRDLAAAAEQDLVAQIAAELRGAIDGGFTSAEAARDVVGQRLDAIHDAWVQRWYGQLDRLLRDASEQDLGGRDEPSVGTSVRPSQHWYGQNAAAAQAQRNTEELRALIQDITPHAEQIGRSFVEIFAGFDEDLRPGMDRAYGEAAKIAAAAVEIGLLIHNELDTRRLEGLYQERRDQLREGIGTASREIADRVLVGSPETGRPGLRSAIEAIIGQLDTVGDASDADAARDEERAAQLRGARETLDRLLLAPPVAR